MNNAVYVASALRTEAPVTSEMLARFHAVDLTRELYAAIQNAIKAGQRLDVLKKVLFYNKPLEIADANVVVDHPRAVACLQGDVIRMIHAAIGMNTESSEILEALSDYVFEGMDLDTINLIEEGGDQFWYMAIYADACSATFEDMQDRNIRKLRARYGDKFSETAAVTRNLDAEQTELSHSNAEIACSCGKKGPHVPTLGCTNVYGDSQILSILQAHAGEGPAFASEGAVEVLQRIIKERDECRHREVK